MYEVIALIVLAFIWIGFATIEDLRKREVANWLNFSLIIFAIGFRFFYCLFASDSFSFLYQGLIGVGIFFVLHKLLYYGRMFAGGDAKLMLALGAILPFSDSFFINMRIFILFFLIFLVVGAIYGLSISFILGLKNFKSFKKEFFKLLKSEKKKIFLVMVLGLILMLFGFFESLLFGFGILVFILRSLYIYAKSVDEVCMVKKVESSRLSEGDWLLRDLRLGKRLIKAKWDGLSKEEIKLIKKNRKDVLIRNGIPFVPVFFFSFLFLVSIYFFKTELLYWFW